MPGTAAWMMPRPKRCDIFVLQTRDCVYVVRVGVGVGVGVGMVCGRMRELVCACACVTWCVAQWHCGCVAFDAVDLSAKNNDRIRITYLYDRQDIASHRLDVVVRIRFFQGNPYDVGICKYRSLCEAASGDMCAHESNQHTHTSQ